MENYSKSAEILEEELPGIITKIAKNYSIAPYIQNLDFLEERIKKWHQFGLVTHTKKVRKVFLNELDSLLQNWRIYEKVQEVLEEKVGNIRKKDLLEISIPLHDLGKIIAYENKRKNRNHERLSRDLIYNSFLGDRLKNLGLSERQINYIANCILVHDVIGKEVRDRLKEEEKLNFKQLSEKHAWELCRNVAMKYKNTKVELGIFFLCDCLGKTDIRIDAINDYELIKNEEIVIRRLEEEKLPLEIRYAIMQLPLNTKLVEIYLRNIFDQPQVYL